MLMTNKKILHLLALVFSLFVPSQVFAQGFELPIIGPQKVALATFEVGNETFNVQTDNQYAIAQLIDLWWGNSKSNIPIGNLAWGPGEGGHNKPWSWHMDGDTLFLAEFAIEVCDGAPSHIENNLYYWIKHLGYYCPWSAALTDLKLMYQ